MNLDLMTHVRAGSPLAGVGPILHVAAIWALAASIALMPIMLFVVGARIAAFI